MDNPDIVIHEIPTYISITELSDLYVHGFSPGPHNFSQ